jgi:5'-nucleotidase
MSRPEILVTNDDGINASGIKVLADKLSEIGNVTIVAPLTEKSAVSHAITLTQPLRIVTVDSDGEFFGYGITGTPADCVKIALRVIIKKKPDIVVSGINQGPNTGVNILYSGTVSAAAEGTLYGIPSIAVSLGSFVSKDFTVAAQVTSELVMKVLQNGLPKGVCLNLNVPSVKRENIKGVKVTRQGMAPFEEIFLERMDPRNHPYYWMDGRKLDLQEDDDTDDTALREGWISITPVQYNLTSEKSINIIKSWDLGIIG